MRGEWIDFYAFEDDATQLLPWLEHLVGGMEDGGAFGIGSWSLEVGGYGGSTAIRLAFEWMAIWSSVGWISHRMGTGTIG